MGTTMVVALVQNNEDAIIANVGDSRAYILRGAKMSQVSVDHSVGATNGGAGTTDSR